jgi:hypothetical protein
MATKKTDPQPNKAPPEERYVQGDPIPAAEATEADTESVWALFSETPGKPEPDFPKTDLSPL